MHAQSPGPDAPRVVSIGECMVEMAPNPDGSYHMGFAGDALNTAWYLRRALPSARVDFLSAVGTDALSERMLAFFEAAGIGTAYIRRVPERTVGLYLIELAHGERSFAYWRERSAARLLAEDADHLERALEGARVAYFSAITLAILSGAHRETLSRALARARARGTLIVLDTNLRPRLWPDAATMRAAVSEAARGADIVLPSFDEELDAFGDESPAATARRYAALGVPLVVVKNGAGEIVTLENGRPDAWTPPHVTGIVDTTAAGDSFGAGFIAARLSGASLREALAAASDLAGRVIRARGALVET